MIDLHKYLRDYLAFSLLSKRLKFKVSVFEKNRDRTAIKYNYLLDVDSISDAIETVSKGFLLGDLVIDYNSCLECEKSNIKQIIESLSKLNLMDQTVIIIAYVFNRENVLNIFYLDVKKAVYRAWLRFLDTYDGTCDEDNKEIFVQGRLLI